MNPKEELPPDAVRVLKKADDLMEKIRNKVSLGLESIGGLVNGQMANVKSGFRNPLLSWEHHRVNDRRKN